MIRPSCGDMDCAEDLFILDVPSAKRKKLGSEAEFTQLADDGVTFKLCDMMLEGFWVA